MTLPKRIIVHTENSKNVVHALNRAGRAITGYYCTRPSDGKRLTVRFTPQGESIVYHDKNDPIVFVESSCEEVK